MTTTTASLAAYLGKGTVHKEVDDHLICSVGISRPACGGTETLVVHVVLTGRVIHATCLVVCWRVLVNRHSAKWLQQSAREIISQGPQPPSPTGPPGHSVQATAMIDLWSNALLHRNLFLRDIYHN